MDEGEACDDGNQDDTDACTSFCTKNVCGDGKLFKAVEECDLGAGNGTACTSAEYGSTCSSCSTSCKLTLTQGGYCGNGVKDPGSPEQCDGTSGITSSITCKGLGYDYAKKYRKVKLAASFDGKDECTVNCGGQSISSGRVWIAAVPSTGGGTLPTPFTITKSLQGIIAECTQEELVEDTFTLGKDCYGAQLQFSDEVITCGSACTYGGCAYCGAEPGQGKVEGLLKDSLFQQPVQDARVTLFYKGLQVGQTTSDGTGYFIFNELDTHAGCDQYKIVIDSYADNPLTSNFDESKRGGYMPVKVGPFMPNNQSLVNVVTASGQGRASTYTGGPTDYQIAEINMLPKLGPNEYIAQFWWDPVTCNTTADCGATGGTCKDKVCTDGIGKMIEDYQKSGTCSVSGASCTPGPPPAGICTGGGGNCVQNDKSAFLAKRLNDYHDLVVRTPFTYTPGTYGSCALTPRPTEFGEDGRLGDLCANHVDGNLSKPFTDACSSVDYVKSTNDNDERFNFIISGMGKCTNKIRATAARTCQEITPEVTTVVREYTNKGCNDEERCTAALGHNLVPTTDGNTFRCQEGGGNTGYTGYCQEIKVTPSQFVKDYPEYGCSSGWDCTNPAKYGLVAGSGNEIKCSGAAEPARQGSPKVLNGSAGAYLFCFHPEAPNKESDCTNFIVPPQSVFISGKGGVYDVIISQYRMLAGGAYRPQRVITWLYDHNAEVRLYDKNGLYDVWKYREVNPNKKSWPPEYSGASSVVCPNGGAGDSTTFPQGGIGRGIKGAVRYPTDAGWPPIQYKALYMTLATGVNQSWVPFSIDTTSKLVKVWKDNEDGTTLHAAYRYFADLYTTESVGQTWVGDGWCWFNTCKYVTGTDSQGKDTVWPPNIDGTQQYVCSDNKGKYSGDPDDPPCTSTDQTICVKYYGADTKKCTKTPDPNTRCVRFCTDPKGKDICEGTINGSSDVAAVEAFCGGPIPCVESKGSGLFR
ncbi:hypothetical protein A3D73_03365 [Candidatus Uhrbacteria bacterium RIFCSPHIGHO2_02_FULL_60_44]|nr:MAG: hypothetical protein A3D73_03365 [Candidatus Uhrbacteria bacterium RIFCSPHIGHO2_02_FULL_60_44]